MGRTFPIIYRLAITFAGAGGVAPTVCHDYASSLGRSGVTSNR